jgi:hypothetical protein
MRPERKRAVLDMVRRPPLAKRQTLAELGLAASTYYRPITAEALRQPDRNARELACRLIDHAGVAVFESRCIAC